jgi:hypothetical protein
MVIKASRAVLTERCRLMCKQRGRQHSHRLTRLSVSKYSMEMATLSMGRPSCRLCGTPNLENSSGLEKLKGAVEYWR